MFILAGMNDPMSPIASRELVFAKLLGVDRDLTIGRLPDAGHGLLPDGGVDLTIVSAEYKRLRDWAAGAE